MNQKLTLILAAGILVNALPAVAQSVICRLPATVEYRGDSESQSKTGHAEYESNGTGIPKRYLVETISESANTATLTGSGYTSGDVSFSTTSGASRSAISGSLDFEATLTWPQGDTASLLVRYREAPYNYATTLDSTDFGGSTSGSGTLSGDYTMPERAYLQMTGSYGDYASGTADWTPDATDGTQTSTYTYTNGPTVEDHNGGLQLYSGSLATSFTVDSPTVQYKDTTSTYIPARQTVTLSDEHTTAELESYAQGLLDQSGSWDTDVLVATRDLSSDELDIDVSHFQARITWQSELLTDYIVQWDEVTALDGEEPVVTTHQEYVAGNGYGQLVFATSWIDPPSEDGYVAVCNFQVITVDSCESCEVAWSPGVGWFKLGSVEFDLDLGKADFGRFAGRLSVKENSTSTGLATPEVLDFLGNTNLVDVIYDNGVIRQANSEECLADIVVNDAYSYDVKFYSAANVLGKVGDTYATQNNPYVTWHVENPAASTNDVDELIVTENRDGSYYTNHYRYFSSTDKWELTSGNGFRTDTLETTWNSSTEQETRIRKVYDAATNLVSETHEIYQLSTNGLLLLETVHDPSGLDLVSRSTYDDQGRLETTEDYNGYWEMFEYDDSGRIDLHSRVRNNTTNSAYGGKSVMRTYHSYDASVVSGSGDDVSIDPLTPRRTYTAEAIDAFYTYTHSRSYTVLTNGFRQDIVCTSANDSWSDSDNLVTTTRYFTNGLFEGRIQTIDHPDQTRHVFLYQSNATEMVTTVLKGSPDSASATNILTGTKSVLKEGPAGETLLSETYFKNSAGQYTLTDRQTYSYLDDLNLSHQIVYLNGTTQTVQYACCGVELIQSPDGTTTEFFYNPLRQQTAVKVTPHNVIVTNILDAEGRVLQTKLIGSSGGVIDVSGVEYDAIGRPLQVTNALGGVSSYSYEQDTDLQTIVSITNPDGGTVTNTYARDGNLLEQAGTAAYPKQWQYWTHTKSKLPAVTTYWSDDGGGTSQWISRLSNAWGQNYRTDYSTGGSLYSYSSAYDTRTYNDYGQVTASRDPDGVYNNLAYNDRGEVEIVSQNRGGGSTTINYNGVDGITQTVTDVTLRGATSVWKTDTYVWPDDNVDASNLVSTVEQSVDGLERWSTLWDGVTALTTYSVLDLDPANGLAMLTVTNADSSYSVTTNQYGRLISVTRFDADSAILGREVYGYDQFGRRSTVTDLRNGTTTYYHNDAGQVSGMVTPAPGAGQSALVTTNSFDTMGRLLTTVLPDGSSLTNEYYLTGLLKKRSGSQTYPVQYTYDVQGRVKTMVTWGDSGAQTNSWTYDSDRGWLSAIIYPDGSSNSFTRTYGGRLNKRTLARKQGAANTYQLHTYHSDGNLKSAYWYADNSTSKDVNNMLYTRLGRLKEIQTRYPNGLTGPRITRQYGLHGNLTTESYTYGPLAGLSVTNGYDSLLRRTGMTVLDGTTVLTDVQYGYDDASRVDEVTEGLASASLGYVTHSPLLESVTFAHNGTTRLTTQRSYDYVNRLTSISSTNSTLSSPISFDYGLNTLSQRTGMTNAAGDYWVYQYDSKGQVTSAKRYWADDTLVAGQQYEFAFDDIGNPTTVSSGGTASGTELRSVTSSVNTLNQYSSRTIPGYAQSLGSAHSNATVTVNLTATERKGEYFRGEVLFDNSDAPVWASLTNIAVLSNVLASEVLEKFIAETPETFAYDPDGNLTNDGHWVYSWDADNRLLGLETDSAVPEAAKRKLDFDYDPLRRRILSTVSTWTNSAWETVSSTKFVYNGWNLVAELNASDDVPVRTYAWAGGFDSLLWVNDRSGGQTNTHFVAYDANANVSALIDASDGSLSAQYDYGPFGDVIRATGSMALENPIRFSCKYQDPESGLFYYGYRYYSPQHQKWLSRDPIGFDGGLNLYGFVGNDPVNLVDPWGLAWYDWTENLASWARRQHSEISTSVNAKTGNGLHWTAAASLNTASELTAGILTLPNAISQLGEATGTTGYVGDEPLFQPISNLGTGSSEFVANPSWETAPGALMDLSVTASILAPFAPTKGRVVYVEPNGQLVFPFYAKMSTVEISALRAGGAIGNELVNAVLAERQAAQLELGLTRIPCNPVAKGTARTFTSTDPLVADLANRIESLYPGHVVGVNVPLRDAAGSLMTDADILLQNSVIQVKSGGSAQGLLRQLQRSKASTGLPSIGFGPNLPANSLRTLSQQGGLVTGDANLLIQVIKP